MECGIIDPVAVDLGFLQVRWYALAYIVGILIGWRYVSWLAKRPPVFMEQRLVDDFLLWATLGVVLGGRLGYVLFYKPGYYLENPVEIPMLWTGGMSFHGGMLGVVLALVLFARYRKLPLMRLADAVACAVPIGLFFGRIANFINGELFGRASDVSWAIVFPCDPEQVARHPSQLYQAFLEGIVLLIVLAVIRARTDAWLRPGAMTGIFLIGYGIARIIGEFFRMPDSHLGFLVGEFLTMGMLLSLPMIAVGIIFVMRAYRRPALDINAGMKTGTKSA